MISRQKAIWLLSKYETTLNLFQTKIEESSTGLLRCDAQIIPNVIAALKAISQGEETFTPSVASSGMSSIKSLDNDPQQALQNLLTDDYFSKHFKDMCAHYGKDDDTFRAAIERFHSYVLPEKLVLYKAKNGELAVKFPTLVCRDAFIKQLGGQQTFAAKHAYFANQKCPAMFPENPLTIYIPTYKAKNGELAAVFPNVAMREAFRNLLRHAEEKCMSVYPGQEALYFNDRQLHNAGYNFTVVVPMEISFDRYRAAVEIGYAARMIAQGMRSTTSLFAQLPQGLGIKIAALATDARHCISEGEGIEVAKDHLSKPSV